MKSQLMSIPNGAAGTKITLEKMRDFIRHYVNFYPLIAFSRALVSKVNEKNLYSEATAIQQFVRDKIRYVRDPRLTEAIQTPVITLDTASGDCDDKSILAATLLEAIGFKTRLVAIGIQNRPYYQHVYPEVLIGDKWVPVETTEPVTLGWEPPNVTKKMVVEV